MNWLEDGDEFEDEEKYWRRTTHHEGSVTEVKIDKTAAAGGETEVRSGTTSDDAGTDGGVAGREPAFVEDRLKPETQTRLRKLLPILSDFVEVVVSFFKSLRATDWLLLGAVVVLLLVVMTVLFPTTLAWAKAIINVRKWPWWIWTSISLAVLGFLVWLRSRYE